MKAQEVSTALIAAEQRIGELLLAIPKQAGANNYSRDVEKLKTKSETVKDMGYTKDEASDYQQMAKNPEVVQKVIEDAIIEKMAGEGGEDMDSINFHETVSYNEQMILRKPEQADELNKLQEAVIDYMRSGGVPVLDDVTGLYIVPSER